MSNAGKEIDPRKHHFLVRGVIFFIILLGVREGSFFIFPYMVNDAASNILPLLTVTNVISIISCILLLWWLKIGFWIFLGVQILNFLLGLTAGLSIIFSLIGVISAGLLWLFMRIPMDGGYSTWDYLSGNYKTIREEETTDKNKQCRMCNTVYAGSLVGCPHCGSYLYSETTEDIFAAQKKEAPEEAHKEAPAVEVKSDMDSDNKNAEIERLEKLFDATTDEKEKSLIAKQLYELGVMYYWRFMPRDRG